MNWEPDQALVVFRFLAAGFAAAFRGRGVDFRSFGSNRFAYQLGLPTVFASGRSYRDPALTSLEVLPTLTFYEANDDPFGAARSAKDVLFSVEAHLTRNLGRRVWVSADMLYRLGGGAAPLIASPQRMEPRRRFDLPRGSVVSHPSPTARSGR